MKNDLALNISEVFYSIQGESSYAGYPCVFIRLAGCNLRCRFCDARYTYEEKGVETKIGDILKKVAEHPKALVEITGGEPLLQDAVYPLMEELLAAGRTVLLETNGSVSLAKVPDKVIKIMDIKCPGSGMHEHLKPGNFDLLTAHDEVKFVLSSREDYDWAVQLIQDQQLAEEVKILFSPARDLLAPADLAQWLLEDELPVRLQLQLHTILWPDKNRGV